jgi:hypothetical protein
MDHEKPEQHTKAQFLENPVDRAEISRITGV